MSIKARIVFAFVLSGLLISSGVIGYVTIQMRNDARNNYISSSGTQLRLMTDYIEAFMQAAMGNISALAQSDELVTAKDIFPRLVDKPTKTVYRLNALDPEAKHLASPLLDFERKHDEYVEVYVGYADGSFLSTLDGLEFPPNFDMSKRPWYQARANAAEDAGLVPAYTSMSGETVFAITHKLKDSRGNLTGVLGIDVTLAGLAKQFAELSKGDSGYFVLIENTGRVLCDPQNPGLVGKVMGKDITDPALLKVMSVQQGIVPVTIDGEAFWANVSTTSFGWKLVSVQSEAAIFALSNSTTRTVILITLSLVLASLVGGVLLSHSISKPLSSMMTTADEISSGNLDAKLNPADYYGELAHLQRSINGMVDNLRRMVNTSAQKTAEAESKTIEAEKAMSEAEAARRQAENARREGMLAAAGQLESVVRALSSASSRLSTQVDQSNMLSRQAAERLEQAATAMGQMNATVQDVARNAASASDVSAETKNKAGEGAQIVQRSLSSIEQVLRVSLDLKTSMSQLNEHSQAITQIMGVISDIADQTNLLALNAAIEAARAGEAGRGFAVVADEVRKLAEKTMASTTKVSSAIVAIQNSAYKNMASVDSAVQQIEQATAFATQSGHALEDIVTNADATADQVSAIATASEEQSASSEEINRAIMEVNSISAKTADAMDEAAQAVAELTAQAQNLSRLVNDMKVG